MVIGIYGYRNMVMGICLCGYPMGISYGDMGMGYTYEYMVKSV
jgi:hypothetical protein